MLEAIWICAAFALGFLVRQINLPPLIGYLITGFVLYGFGYSSGPVIQELSDAGVTLLLFTIGLKLQLKGLARPHVWVPALLHMALLTGFLGLVLYALPVQLSLPKAMLIGFALSYSSTVFAVKVLEEKGEMSAIYGQVAIGVLIVQDLVAVGFMAVSTGKGPEVAALLLIPGLFVLRWILFRVMDRAGHNELLVLFGLAMALGSYELFELLGLKGDLGALVFGVLLAPHRESGGLSKLLLSLKDFFLVGFFISVGLNGLPTIQSLLVAVLLVLLMPIKAAPFFFMFTALKVRSRTAFLSTLTLSNYSEFGIIIAFLAVQNGWIAEGWLLTTAVALALSFLAASPLNTASHDLYESWHEFLLRFQRKARLPEERFFDIGDAKVLVFGMGRVGRGAYEELAAVDNVLGIEMNPERVEQLQAQNLNVIQGSATDSDFWDRITLEEGTLKLVLLSMPQLEENVFATRELKSKGFDGVIAAISKYEDEASILKEAGVDYIFNFYTEAGAGFAADALIELEERQADRVVDLQSR